MSDKLKIIQDVFDVENDKCIQVYEELLDCFKRCELYADPYLNIIAIFFHDIMRIITGYVLRHGELANGVVDKQLIMKNQPLRKFPYIGYHDVLNGISPDKKQYKTSDLLPNARMKWFSHLSTLTGFHRNKHIGVSAYVFPQTVRQSWKKLLRNSYTLTFPKDVRIWIPQIDKQMKELRQTLEQIITMFGLPGESISSLDQIIQRHFNAFIANKPIKDPYNLLIVWSLLGIEPRILAARARGQGIPVISHQHGNGDGMLDIPALGYGEKTFTNVYIGYGHQGAVAQENGKYLKGLYEQPRYVMSNASIIRKIYNSMAPIPRLSDLRIAKYMYVPTCFQWDRRYGPLYGLNDLHYLAWQQCLVKNFPGLIYKKHPKGVHYLNPPSKNVKTENLEDCWQSADVFIFDIITSAFVLAASTNKPIIYFHIKGHGNIHRDAIKFIKDRCIWIDVDLKKPLEAFERVNSLKDKKCDNIFSTKFSLKEDDETRGETFFKIVKDILP